jgi:hypothetical protein
MVSVGGGAYGACVFVAVVEMLLLIVAVTIPGFRKSVYPSSFAGYQHGHYIWHWSRDSCYKHGGTAAETEHQHQGASSLLGICDVL